jgi:C4-dicarboxylate-specific signal transduction histidine kinase
MATGMAHELNQPLSSISFAAQNAELRLARQPLDMPALAAKLEKIVQEARRASKLVEHMRIFARNEREELRPVPWRAVLEAAEEMLRPRLRGCTLAVALPDDLPDVMGAPIPMEQVLLNLILNAVDAYDGTAPDAPRRVTVQGRVESGAVVLRVADRAGGIPAHLLSRVFEPFFTTKPPGQGTGLGLALCFGTIVEMGGTITAGNEDGGAVFEIRLPPAVAGAERASDAPARRAG